MNSPFPNILRTTITPYSLGQNNKGQENTREPQKVFLLSAIIPGNTWEKYSQSLDKLFNPQDEITSHLEKTLIWREGGTCGVWQVDISYFSPPVPTLRGHLPGGVYGES